MKTLLDKLNKKTVKELYLMAYATELLKNKEGYYTHEEISLKLLYLLEALNFDRFSREKTLGEIVDKLCEGIDLKKFQKENGLK